MSISSKSFRDRIHKGDIVYFVEGESIIGTGDLVVKKATVRDAEEGRRYPVVMPWDITNEQPSTGMCVSKSPRELFTASEVAGELEIEPDMSTIDTLVHDPLANRAIVPILGAKVIERLANDEARRPGDPEY